MLHYSTDANVTTTEEAVRMAGAAVLAVSGELSTADTAAAVKKAAQMAGASLKEAAVIAGVAAGKHQLEA